MKKIFIVLLTTLAIFFGIALNPVVVVANETFIWDQKTSDTRYVNRLEHRTATGEMIYKNSVSQQVYNYLGFNNLEDDYHLVPVNGYEDFGYGMKGLNEMMRIFEEKNPHLQVLGGINGDFYAIQDTGEASSTQVIDYEVVYRGRDSSTAAVVIDSEGKASFKKLVNSGNEIVVINSDNEIKKRVKVTKINENITDDSGVNVFFDNYVGNVPANLKPITVKGQDIKPILGRAQTSPAYYQFGKGYVVSSASLNVEEKTFKVVSKEISDVIEIGDKVLFQSGLEGGENIRHAFGVRTGMNIVSNGKVVSINDPAMHPRTAVGIKASGEVFTIVADGRDRPNDRFGVTLEELGQLMKRHGAVEAYNYDGGGSSTLMLGGSEDFEVLNQLSDGRIRSISNGLLIVKGPGKSAPINVPENDTRTAFASPKKVYLDQNKNVRFDLVDGASSYEVKINDLIIETNSNIVPMKFTDEGENVITVRAKSTLKNKASAFSNPVKYITEIKDIQLILDYLREATKNNRGGK